MTKFGKRLPAWKRVYTDYFMEGWRPAQETEQYVEMCPPVIGTKVNNVVIIKDNADVIEVA